jgi:Holliday junction resolvasome RuvABC ATP-dependent DNA helicase subunit
MALSERQMDHPQFVAVSTAVNEALSAIAQRFGCEAQLQFYESSANIAVDKMTALVLRALNDAELGA